MCMKKFDAEKILPNYCQDLVFLGVFFDSFISFFSQEEKKSTKLKIKESTEFSAERTSRKPDKK